MIDLALTYPEYRQQARKVRLITTSSEKYYGKGYQDMVNRVPQIDGTRHDLRWKPRIGLRDAVKRIYDAYRGRIADARQLVK
jgi:nucleoside-diphosphate-sugar epimerase